MSRNTLTELEILTAFAKDGKYLNDYATKEVYNQIVDKCARAISDELKARIGVCPDKDDYIPNTLPVYICPVCGEQLNATDKYCPNCGQAIDWGED